MNGFNFNDAQNMFPPNVFGNMFDDVQHQFGNFQAHIDTNFTINSNSSSSTTSNTQQSTFYNSSWSHNFGPNGSTSTTSGSSNINGGHAQNPNIIPAASKTAIVNLPEVVITKKDLALDEGQNSSCCICLEDQKLCGTGVKMPCGHIFCKQCIHDWLAKQCTCPVCRFELATNDAAFEKQRKMKTKRKPNYKRAELSRMTAKELKSILSTNEIPNCGFSEKKEIVEAICDSDKVKIITESDEHDEYYEKDFRKMTVDQIRNAFKMFGLVMPDMSRNPAKDELIGLLMNSGKVSPDRPSDTEDTEDD